MKHDAFIGQVQHRAQLSSRGEAERATRATLETLGERLAGGEPKDLASQLPLEIARHLKRPWSGLGVPFSLGAFFWRVSEREEVSLEHAKQHARAVMEVVCAAVSPGEIDDIRAQLPEEFHVLLRSTKEEHQVTNS
jgi:uncharacterized protein (DUF2267 family)